LSLAGFLAIHIDTTILIAVVNGHIGAPGWLLNTGDLAEVRPLDDAGPLAAADPRKANAPTTKARGDAIVRNALAGEVPIVVIVLGAAHDLRESIRAAEPKCGYTRLTTKKLAELVVNH
jgi:hypothetical protein